ncbi:NAD(P)/FAD-dependent oxidoreductase [Chitinimonas lacunae]|uniref:NAD(P)/FAD-dependent oxidoreductase n=1 Tax=Chitinimonas lacunae TaxID=1963018 RepID=A0ABV8MTR0_9NEIS
MLDPARQSHIDSYYVASAGPLPDHPELEGELDCDVCVVGGGLAGVSAALELAERGYSVVLLEGSRIGHAASGRNGGQVINGYACDMDTLHHAVGDEAARAMWAMSLEAIEMIDSRIKRHAIDCHWRRGHLLAAVKPRHYTDLVRWREQAGKRYGYRRYELWDQATLRRRLDSPRYQGGLYDSEGGHLHPLRYLLGLAAAASAVGVRIFERSPVERVESGERPLAHSSRGRVRCRHLVLATNVYIDRLRPDLGSRIMPVGTYIIATEPLAPELATQLISGDFAVCDTRFVLDYYRFSVDHRLLFGGKVSYSGLPPPDLKSAMRRDMLKVFPQLRDTAIDYAWGGFVDITMNRAPHWGRVAPNVYFCQGFSGHGVAVTGLAGRLIAEAIAGSAERLDLFSRLQHLPFPGGRLLRTPSLVLGMLWYRLRDYL